MHTENTSVAPRASRTPMAVSPKGLPRALNMPPCAAPARQLPAATELLVCGGGALNAELMRQLQAAAPSGRVLPSDDRGLPALQVEATAFAWLAWCWFERRPASLSEVTGARAARVLGALYPATP